MTAAAAERTGGRGVVRIRRRNWLPGLVGLTVCLLPLLRPAGPGNTAVADAAIALAVGSAALWVTRERLVLALPYAWGVALLMLGGAFAATAVDAPPGVAFVLVQDLVLLVWAAALALGRHDPAIVRAATRAWGGTAVVYATVMVAAYLLGVDSLAGVSVQDGVRASYTFGDPNLAANYLVMSLFVMAACARPRVAWLRRLGYLVVLLAIVFTGSNGGVVTLLVAGVVGLTLGRYRKEGPIAALAVVASLAAAAVLVLGYVAPRVDVGAIREQATNSIPLLRDSVGRSNESTSERATIVHEGLQLWLRGDGSGYGPARTKATLQADQASYVKEAHNDYLATLLERGPIGVLGLLLLLMVVAVNCARLAVTPLPRRFTDMVPRPWLLAAVGPGMAVAALFYEVLHFRHLWTWLGLVAALVLAIRDDRRGDRASWEH